MRLTATYSKIISVRDTLSLKRIRLLNKGLAIRPYERSKLSMIPTRVSLMLDVIDVRQ